MMRDYLLVYVNGQRKEVRGDAVFMPLSSWLRYELGATGTKVVCAEGDCGACAVLVGRLGGDEIEYRPITSCIAYMFQFDGAHIVTIEGLLDDGKPNPVMEAMIAAHGAQCGFCTPGFVVTLCGTRKRRPNELREALIGNLCRCTGYDAILQAAANTGAVRDIEERYPRERFVHEPSEVLIECGGRIFYKPRSLGYAIKFRAEHPDCMIIAGGTDLGVMLNKGTRQCAVVMSLSAIDDLRTLVVGTNEIVVGGNTTLAELAEVSRDEFDVLYEMLARHGSPLIRNAATLAGNIANGSPIGDALPLLFVLEAQVELAGLSPFRRVNLNDFYTGYRKTVMRPDEIIRRIMIPRPAEDEIVRVYKVSKRRDLDISTFMAAIWMRLDRDVIEDVRIAYGGVAAVILRLPKTEAALRGQTLREELFEDAGQIAQAEITPISDVRGGREYRLQLAANILLKFFHDASSCLRDFVVQS
jgi:xanthine dehydrogenase small subunit